MKTLFVVVLFSALSVAACAQTTPVEPVCTATQMPNITDERAGNVNVEVFKGEQYTVGKRVETDRGYKCDPGREGM